MFLEVQGLRGVAIISVLFFHLWPKSFPNGYVGVDMFFVISGYLMAMIYSKYKGISIRDTADFYYKRAKRILPLYYLAVPSIFLAGHLWLGPGWIESHNRFALYSLMLLKNMRTIWDGHNYFLAFQTAAHQKDLFLHLWSLAVEIQFYLIVPFLFGFMHFLKRKDFKIIFLLILGSITCAQYYYSNPIFSFNYPLSRLWQFGLGMIAFIAKRETNEEIGKEKPTSATRQQLEEYATMCAFIPILIMFVPQIIRPEVMRPLATVCCFQFLLFGNEMSKKILTSKFLTYTGDISYSLYLIHWPIIVLFQHYYSPQFVLGIIILLSVLSYHYYENAYRSFSIPKVALLLLGIAILNAVVFLALIRCPFVTQKLDTLRYEKVSTTHLAAVKENMKFLRREGMNPRGIYNQSSGAIHPTLIPPWGVYDFPKSNGSRKIMVIGNSYAINQAGIIHDAFNGNYSEFKWVAGLGLQVFYDIWGPPDPRAGQHEKCLQQVEEFKPDILFVIARKGEDLKSPITTSNISDDPYVRLFNQNTARLEKVCGKILIQESTPLIPLLHLNCLIDALSVDDDLREYNIDKEKADEETLPGDTRVKAINCQKCRTFDIRPAFQDKKKYLTFDPDSNVSFWDNDMHLTMAGLERIKPIYKEIIGAL